MQFIATNLFSWNQHLNFQSCDLNVLVGFVFFGGVLEIVQVRNTGHLKVCAGYANATCWTTWTRLKKNKKKQPSFHLMSSTSCYLLKFTALTLKSSIRSSILLSASVDMFITSFCFSLRFNIYYSNNNVKVSQCKFSLNEKKTYLF